MVDGRRAAPHLLGMDASDPTRAKPAPRPRKAETREDRLAQALRDNLRRRKAGSVKPAAPPRD